MHLVKTDAIFMARIWNGNVHIAVRWELDRAVLFLGLNHT